MLAVRLTATTPPCPGSPCTGTNYASTVTPVEMSIPHTAIWNTNGMTADRLAVFQTTDTMTKP